MKVELSSKELSIIIQALQTDIVSDEAIQLNDTNKKELLDRLMELQSRIN